jgi:hypothetical protein
MSAAMSRSPLWAAALPAVALAAGGARWLVQGSGNLYTDTARRLYVPDPDLGWRAVDGPAWLGLELLGLTAALAAMVLAGAWLIRRRERRGGAWRVGRAALWTAAALPLAVPVWAWSTGLGPAGAVDRLPAGLARAPSEGIDGALPGLPAGRYRVLEHRGTSLTAQVSGGGESFDALFGGLRGSFRGDPSDLTQPMSAAITAEVATVDTGIAMRSRHARESYLRADEYPELRFVLEELTAAEQRSAREVGFAARGVLELLGRRHPAEVTGSLRAPDADALARLGLDGREILLVSAETSLSIAESELAPDAGDFDHDEIPIVVSLVLVFEGPEKEASHDTHESEEHEAR